MHFVVEDPGELVGNCGVARLQLLRQVGGNDLLLSRADDGGGGGGPALAANHGLIDLCR